MIFKYIYGEILIINFEVSLNLMEIFVSIFVVLLSISGGMCQAGATTGNNWSSTLNCFLITGSTVLCQACPPSHCGTDYYYPYLEIKEVASGVNSLAVTKCIKGSECTDTESFVEFKGTLDIYSQYWCAKQSNYIYIYIYI